MSKLSNNQRKKRQGVPSIAIDELYNAQHNRGMCSFLERTPEEARLRREQRLDVDKADLADQAELTVPFPVDRPETVAIPQGDPTKDTSKLPAAGDIQIGDIHRAGILPPIAESSSATKDNTSQSGISTKVDKARSGLELAAATLERLAKTKGISHWDGRSQVGGIFPAGGGLPDSPELSDSTAISKTAPVITTPDVTRGAVMTDTKTTRVDHITTPVATTPAVPTSD